MGVLRVAPLGTCRVHRPLRKISKGEGIEVFSDPINQYVHTTGEIIQRIGLLNGDSPNPESLEKYIFERDLDRGGPNFPIMESDLFVIEVSSIKQISLGNYSLQLNRVINEAKPKLGSRFDEWMSILRRRVKDGYRPVDRVEEISNDPWEMIDQLSSHIQDELDLERGVGKIIELLGGNVCLVNHINIEKPDGEKLLSRNLLCEMLSSVAKRFGVLLFDPTNLVLEERSKMLKKGGLDINHYSDYGEERIGRELMAFVRMVDSMT